MSLQNVILENLKIKIIRNWTKWTLPAWIDSGGLLPFPGGESREEFKRRNVTGFQKAVNGCLRNGISLAALVVHGGTIMNVMEEYADEDRSFYDWHVQNGKGYEVEIDPELWKKGRNSCMWSGSYKDTYTNNADGKSAMD